MNAFFRRAEYNDPTPPHSAGLRVVLEASAALVAFEKRAGTTDGLTVGAADVDELLLALLVRAFKRPKRFSSAYEFQEWCESLGVATERFVR